MSDYIKRKDAINAFYTATGDGDKAEWCVGVIHSIPAADVVERKSNKPKTNADRIRSMTDKELAVWLAGAMLYGEPLKVMRIADWEKWLKQESKEWNLT